jgi:asparagine synthase (glutamine-hydrolysing)
VPVEAFTFRYDHHDGPMNEGAQARELAEHFGARHREIEISAKWIAGNMGRLVRAYEEPFTYGLHSARLGPIRDAGVDVVLSGVCTDGWYLSRAEATAFRTARLGRLPLAGLGAASHLGGRLSPVTRRLATLHRLATAPESAVFYDTAANSILSDAERAEMYRDPALAVEGRRRALGLLDASLVHAPGLSRADRYAYLAWQFDWPEHLLWWNHRWGAASNLSVRYPYVDRALADLLAASPRPSPPKADLRSYGETLMPRALASRPKYPQAVPMSHWLRGPLQELVRTHLDVGSVENDGFFDAAVVARLVEEHMSGAADHKWALWTLTSYFVWKDEFGVAARR